MQQETTFDTFCKNIECLNNNNSFFRYTPDNYHVVQHEDFIQDIHPRKFQHLFRNGVNLNELNQNQDRLFKEMASPSINTASSKIMSFIQERFLSKFSSSNKETFLNNIPTDSREIDSRLRTGDYNLLMQLMAFEASDKMQSFSKFMMQRKSTKILPLVQGEIEELTTQIIEVLDTAFSNLDELINIKTEVFSTKQVISGNRQSKANKQKIIINRQQPIQEQQLSIQSSYFDYFNKSKKIAKPPRVKSKQLKREKLKSTGILNCTFRQMKPSQQIQILSPNEVKVKYCTNPSRTINYLIEQCKDIRSIHIFSSTFACSSNIERLFSTYHYLEVITFNCNHQFQYSVLNQLGEIRLKRIKALQIKWGLDRFFNAYHILQSFPIKPWDQFQRLTKTSRLFLKLEELENNETLWVEDDDHAAFLRINKKNFKNIRTLHFYSITTCKIGVLKQINQFDSLTNLITLNLKNISLGERPNFEELIKKNKFIKTLLISNCAHLSAQATQILSCLKNLPFLANFSLIPRENFMNLSSSVITNLVDIKNLYLQTIHFDSREECLDSTCLRSFDQLKKLSHLSVCNACYPIYSDFLSYLDPVCVQQMRLLNIAQTFVDNLAVEYLLRMHNLQYLNIDGLNITGSLFSELCKLHYTVNRKYWGLRYLSIEEKDFINNSEFPAEGLSVENMQIIGKYLPNLTYIDVANCTNLHGYSFQDFKSLETIALDKNMVKSIKVNRNINKFVIQ